MKYFAATLKCKDYQIGQKIIVRLPKAKDITPHRISPTDRDMKDRIGTIIGIYPHHILLQMDYYKISVQKTCIALGLNKFKEVE